MQLQFRDFACQPLNDEHYLEFFDCGHDGQLTNWLDRSARKMHNSERTRVWIMTNVDNPETPVGYFTLSSTTLVASSMVKRDRQGISHDALIPAQLLGKFAIDTGFQGSGASLHMMAMAYRVYQHIASATATRCLVLETRDERLTRYYNEQHGFTRVPRGEDDEGLDRLYMLSSDIDANLDALNGDCPTIVPA